MDLISAPPRVRDDDGGACAMRGDTRRGVIRSPPASLTLAHSHARYLVSMFIAPLVMAYTTPLCMLTRLATDELNTTAEDPAAFRSG